MLIGWWIKRFSGTIWRHSGCFTGQLSDNEKIFIHITLVSTASSSSFFAGRESCWRKWQDCCENDLGLSKSEAQKFTPVFARYFRDFAQTHRQNKGDRLILQQKVIELRLRYRGEFKQIMDEQRANKVFQYEDKFRQEVIRIIKENRRDRVPPRRTKAVLLRD